MLQRLRDVAWTFIKRWINRQFPEVQSISTGDLVTRLESDAPPLLIDVRQSEEYTVSHLPGARHLSTLAAIQQADISPTAPLVLYCSVGYRSARLAQQLQAHGYGRVMNLEGSIFEWYNRGYPVVTDHGPVQRVHPYNRVWGLLLAPDRS
jgi:rhodanese-related sulfurtransferase